MSAGRVFLVGAGPGDPGLLTARALELIASADVILHDRLIPVSALAGARADAEIRYVGKEGGGPAVPQEQTEQLLIDHARAGRQVVRLKGGDPFVFGRGGEEALALRSAGIEFEIVPGVTAGIAAAAYAGIPVTHRQRASALALVTAHEDPDKPASALDWSALAAFPGTLVFYMGVAQLPRIVERLLAGGRAGGEPAAVIERGTLPDQRTVVAPLDALAERARAAGIRPPSVTIVGDVVGLRDTLAWVERRPLHGQRVAVTRARAQSSELASRLRVLGADVIELPAIRIVPLPVEIPDLAGFDLLCLTSPNGVALLFERLRESGRDARALAGSRVAAIGPGTARALAEHGIAADIVPTRFVAEGLVEALADTPVAHALLARAHTARDVLPPALRARGAQVTELALYETVAELHGADAAMLPQADYVTFTSSSTVRFLLDELGVGAIQAAGARLVSIGPVTSATLRERGLEPDVEAARHDIDGLVAALVADAAR